MAGTFLPFIILMMAVFAGLYAHAAPGSKALLAILPRRRRAASRLGVPEEISNISLACRQMAPIRFKEKMKQGEDMFRKRRSLFFK